MDIRKISPELSVSPQLSPQDVGIAASRGFRSLILNRPDGESQDQPLRTDLEAAAKRSGLTLHYLPIASGKVTDEDVTAFRKLVQESPAPVLAFCRSGKRSLTLWALSQAGHLSTAAILETADEAGYDLTGLQDRLDDIANGAARHDIPHTSYDVLVVGGGAGGISAAASILKRRPGIKIGIVEPNSEHYYQPGWTLVGGGVFRREQTSRPMGSVMPAGVKWIKAACSGFEPEKNVVVLEDGERLSYHVLVVAPGLKLDWDGVEGLRESLGRNGVTSNYLFDMAPYTWELVQSLKGGRALFTQPPMPIKCAGAPQKAMYLACDAWHRRGMLKDIDVSFHNAGGVLFGVKEYVPALMGYVEKYGIDLHFQETLIKVDGPAKTATFRVVDGETVREDTREFDMIHVCPPQTGRDFVRQSPLANEQGWIDVNGETLQHTEYGNIFSLGDGCSAPNAKTAAAVRKQAPVVAENALRVLDGKAPHAVYNGYGSCPLTVERGKIVLAEFSYGGALDPSFPSWVVDGTKPSRRSWFMKEKLLPWIYFDFMLTGNEMFAGPTILPHTPVSHEAEPACETGTTARSA